MIAASVYCLLWIVKFFTKTPVKYYIDLLLGYLHFQICCITFLLYFQRVMTILPQIVKRWTKIQRCLYIISSVLLLLNGFAVVYKL